MKITDYPNILAYPDETLRHVSQPVEAHEFGRSLDTFVKDMYRVMEEGRGIGLAAPQIGLLKNILVYKTIGEAEESNACLINPRIVSAQGAAVVEEGCLSLPGIYADVERSASIVVEGQNAYGDVVRKESAVFSAIIIQHEMDHLLGKLFIDKLSPLKRKFLLASYKKKRGY